MPIAPVSRKTSSNSPLTLALHLGVVLALFVTLPYGKFVHGIYRYLALARFARESSAPPAETPTESG